MRIKTFFDCKSDGIIYNHILRRAEGFNSDSHSHEVMELIFLKRGSVTYAVDGREYRLRPNDLVITRPFEIHSIRVDGGEYERYDLLFDETVVPRAVYERIPSYVNVISFDGNSAVISLFDKMDYYASHLDGDELTAIVSGLAREAVVNAALQSDSEAADMNAQANPIVCRAVDYVSANLLTLRGIDDICRELYVTKSHLHHLFVKHLHITPKKYVTTKRLALAHREITSGAMPTQVYQRCGFSDYSTFYRAYRSYFGRSPSERASSQQGAELRL